MRDKYCALTSEKNFPRARGSLEARRHSRAPKLTKVKRLNINTSWQATPLTRENELRLLVRQNLWLIYVNTWKFFAFHLWFLLFYP